MCDVEGRVETFDALLLNKCLLLLFFPFFLVLCLHWLTDLSILYKLSTPL